jgi:hypothetical protein
MLYFATKTSNYDAKVKKQHMTSDNDAYNFYKKMKKVLHNNYGIKVFKLYFVKRFWLITLVLSSVYSHYFGLS